MTQKISSVNIEAATLSSFTGPTISSVAIANSTYVILDDTAVSNAGGYAVVTGTNFVSGAQVLFGSTSATAVSFVNSTRLNVQVPVLTAGSYVMYVQNPDGSTAIRLNGITSSPIPVWATGSTLTSQIDGVPISISLSASSDSSVTYALANGSSLPAGTTLASNGLFSGTITGLSNDTTYNFSVNAIDAENQETLRAFSVTVTAGDANFKDTILLLNGETSNNTWITDASSNAFAITVNGDTRPVAFSPYETVWSNFFDGTGDDLTIPTNSAFTYGTGDFTIEMWVYITANPGSYAYIYGQGPNTTASICLYIQGGVFRVWNGSAIIVGSTSYSLNKWYHVSISRSGTSVKLFLDGVQDGSATSSSNITTGSSFGSSIGRWAEINDPGYFTGYISNVRVLKGTALYTSAFTPPTSPLSAIANTSLLTCQSNRLIDNSTNAFTITKNGDVSVSNFGPFVETDITTGSGYFDGTGDYLSVPSATALNLSTGSFTIEAFMNISATSYLFARRSVVTARGMTLYYDSSTSKFIFLAGDTNNLAWEVNITSTNNFSMNQWIHVAITRNSSNVFTLWVNGNSEATTTSSVTIADDASNFLIGGIDNAGAYTGYISNFRILQGTALYTSNFTPPTSPLTAITNTSLLTLQSRIGENNNRFIDTSGINNIITRSGNTSQGTFSPFQRGGWSNYFDGTGDRLSLATATAFGTGSNTVEFWFFPTDASVTYRAIYDGRSTVNTDTGYGIFQYGLTIEVYGNGLKVATAAAAFSVNTWVHVALVRNSSTCQLYINGVASGSSATYSANLTSTVRIIGDSVNTNFPFVGYVSNLREVTSAVYTAAFTPPTTPLTAITNTVLLTCQSNRFIDNSSNAFAITRNGDVSVQPYSPFRANADYSIIDEGGSMYFDGTGDFLTSNYSINWSTLGTYTIEFWVYHTSMSPVNQTYASTGGTGFTNLYNYANGRIGLGIQGTNEIVSASGVIVANQWQHIAYTFDGTTTRIYVNGIQVASGTTGVYSNNAANLVIGSGLGGLPVFGYITNFRLIRGTRLYTSGFVPPSEPPTPIPGTTLLLNGTNGGIIDYTRKNNLESFDTVLLRNNIKKYGNTSIYIAGVDDYLVMPYSPNFNFSTGPFTIECWINFNVLSGNRMIFDTYTAASAGGGYQLYWRGTGSSITFYANGVVVAQSSFNTHATGTWYHVACTRDSSGIVRIFINGVMYAYTSYNSTIDIATTSRPAVGIQYITGTNDLDAYIDDLRITKGVSRYSSNTSFTPPTQTLPIR